MTALRRPTIKVAATAGVVTHLPGLFYLVALNAITADDPSLARAVVEVLVYNLIWFSVPIAAIVVARRDAEGMHAWIARVNAWARAHEQMLVVAVFASVGTYLVVEGVSGLLA